MGRELFLREAGFQAAFLTAAAVAARMGTAQVAAHQIGLELWVFSALVLDSFAIAAQSLVGAALGSGDAGAASRTAWQVARYGLAAGIAFSVVLAAGWFLIPDAFTSSDAVRHQAHLYWPYFIGLQPAAGVVFALDGVLIGAGDVGFLRTVTLVAASGSLRPDHARRAAFPLGDRRGVGRARRVHRSPADRHAGAHRPWPVGGDRSQRVTRLTRLCA